ncbi:MAG: hypothetical protein JSU85_08695 [Candidatus Zixiibacteriota bacterium]|nr:MAG: hypothetical protein JSU85_08695 [candidate division Zixibacteria bacterium]
MAAEDFFKYPNLIMRIVEKQDFGRTSTVVDEGNIPKLSDRFDTQRKSIREQIQIAEFKFPVNQDGKTFYYQQYANTLNARQSTVPGIAGISSEAYGTGLEDVSFNGVFPAAAERNVIAATDLTAESALTQYRAKDWADNIKRFVRFYLDLNDPYSQIWTKKGYYQATKINIEGLVSLIIGGKSTDRKSNIGYEGTPNKAGYEFIVIDEWAKSIVSIQPKSVDTFTSNQTPISYGWRINATIIEDKLDANFKEIPDDILQLIASYRLPAVSELPVVGPLSEFVNKLVAISNSINEMMNTILTYKNVPNTIVQDYNSFLYANNNILHKIQRIAQL